MRFVESTGIFSEDDYIELETEYSVRKRSEAITNSGLRGFQVLSITNTGAY
jgi:hypothetical protein